jgi:predicted ATPase/class 3 adenylate cyclase
MAQQRKLVTILFIHIDSLSELSVRTGSSQAAGDLWGRLERIVQAHDGQANRPISDSTIAIFGAPTAREDDPERATRVALLLQAELAAFLQENPEAGELAMRIGISTGTVLYDTIGLGGSFMAIGDTVNISSGLIRTYADEPVVAADSTYRQIRGAFDVRPLPSLELPGRPEPVGAYRVVAARARAFETTSWALEGVEAPLIGREIELRRLQTIWQAAMAERQTAFVALVGEAGLGKSRLVDEFDNWIELLPRSPYRFKGRARPATQSVPYGLFRDLLAFQFQIQDSDSPAVARQKLEQGLTKLLGSEEPAHFIGQLIGFDFSGSPHLRGILGDARQIRNRAFHYLLHYFLLATRPASGAVLLLEDIQWADGGSLDLIDHLAATMGEQPFLILCSARPELFDRRPSWGENAAGYERLDLALLPPLASRQLVTAILGKVPDLPDGLTDLVVRRAEGNPFYAEEIIKMLIEDQVIEVGDRSWQVHIDRLAGIRMPTSLQAVLQASVDKLSEAERRVLQQAAVLGQVFWDESLFFLAGKSQAADRATIRQETLASLDVLRGRGYIIRRKESAFDGTEEFNFKHSLLHQVTYDSTLLRQRRLYHAAAAEWLVAQSGGRAGEYAGLIGDHYARAERHGLAAEWFGRAARQAADGYAYDVALVYFQQAVNELAQAGDQSPARRLPLYEGWAEVLLRKAQHAESLSAYRTLLSDAQAEGDLARQAAAWEGISNVYESQGSYHPALDAAEKQEALVRQLVEQAGPVGPAELARALLRKGWVHFRLANTAISRGLAEASLALCEEQANQELAAEAYNLLGGVYSVLGQYGQAIDHRERTLEMYRALGNQMRVATTLSNMGEIARLQGDYAQAVSRMQEALALGEKIGDQGSVLLYRSNLAGALVGLGDYGRAIDHLNHVISHVGEDWFALSEAHRFLAQAYLGQGDYDRALATAQRALALGQGFGDQEDIGGAWYVLGLIAMGQGRPVAADGDPESLAAGDCFARSLDIFAATGMEREQAWVLREWARFELAQGQAEQGQLHWQAAWDLFQQLGLTRQLEQMDRERVG